MRAVGRGELKILGRGVDLPEKSRVALTTTSIYIIYKLLFIIIYYRYDGARNRFGERAHKWKRGSRVRVAGVAFLQTAGLAVVASTFRRSIGIALQPRVPLSSFTDQGRRAFVLRAAD